MRLSFIDASNRTLGLPITVERGRTDDIARHRTRGSSCSFVSRELLRGELSWRTPGSPTPIVTLCSGS